jgi:iron complex transport system permease protein
VALLGLLGALVAARLWGVRTDDSPELASEILALRIERVAMAVLVGASLALAGVLLQGLLRNPLASPDLLGVASGAGLGVMVAVYVAHLAGAGLADPGGLGAFGAAIVGGGGVLAVVYSVSQRRGAVQPASLVMVGVIVGVMCAGLVTLLQHLMPDQGVAAGRLLLGALRDDARPWHLWLVAGVLGACMLVALVQSRAMDCATLSDDEARSVGVRLGRLRSIQFVLAGVLTACAVVLAGPIGFVGLVCPHGARALVGSRHRWVIVAATILGAAMIVGADALAELLRRPDQGRLPLSVLTSLVGGPVFLWMLRGRAQ